MGRFCRSNSGSVKLGRQSGATVVPDVPIGALQRAGLARVLGARSVLGEWDRVAPCMTGGSTDDERAQEDPGAEEAL
jgi:hypothetical protein